MAACHLLVHLLNSTVQSSIAILLVHVVNASSAVVADRDSKVLNAVWLLLKDLAI